jgi:hypothetical protein
MAAGSPSMSRAGLRGWVIIGVLLYPGYKTLNTGKKDQGWALQDEGSAPPIPDEDGPTIMDATTMMVIEGDGTCKTPSK